MASRKSDKKYPAVVFAFVILALIIAAAIFIIKELEIGVSDDRPVISRDAGFYTKAKFYYEQQDYKRTLDIIDNGLNSKPSAADYYKALMLKAAVYDSLSEHELAVKMYKRLIEHPLADEKLRHNLAAAYEHSGNKTKAVEHYEEALKINSDFYPSITALANIYFDLHSYKLAMMYFNKAQKLDRHDDDVLLKTAFIHYKRDEIKKAEEIFQNIKDSLDKHVAKKSLAYLGNIYTERGNVDKAEQMYLKSLVRDDKQPEVLYNLALLYGEIGKIKKAVYYLKLATEIEDEDVDILKSLADIYYQNADYEKCLPYYERILQLDKENSEVYAVLADIYYKTGRHSEAEEFYKRIISSNPNEDLYFNALINLGNIYDDMEKTKSAFSYYKKALSVKPEHPAVHYNLGVLYLKIGVAKEGISELNKSFELNKGDISALKMIAEFYENRGDPESIRLAINTYHRIRKYSQNNPRALFSLGELYYKLNELSRAQNFFSYVLMYAEEGSPIRVDAHLKLALIHTEKGEFEEAEEEYELAIELESSNPLHFYNFGMFYYNLGKYESALEKFRHAQLYNPEKEFSSLIYLASGNCYFKMNYNTMAEKMYVKALELDPSNSEAAYNIDLIRSAQE